MVAGEASGDLLASLLLSGLKARWPALSAAGIGGPRMQAEGFDAWWPSHKLSVFGYVDALRHYRELVGIRNQLRDRLLVQRPDVFIGVDAPDFNFGLEQPLKAQGIRTVHFVCPSIWAWRGGRVKKLAAAADHVLCLFPFEPALLAEHGVAATFVGHPMADRIPLEVPQAEARAALGLADSDTVVALLPGSRRSELRYIGPVLLEAAVRMARQRPGLRFVLPVVPGLEAEVQALVAQHAPGLDLQCLAGRSHEALAACDLTLIASGTATLEAALFKRPMVITYRMHWLNWQYMRHMAYLPWVGLPNILLRDFAVPELLQHAATPEALAREGLAWLDDAPRRERLQARFTDLHHMLRQDTARKASDAIAQVLGA
ncbi:lipid-A-disaccharide synthase [Ideonella dechloratans]|uniref:Lipid-A-disaccharide synthase n=1 Tax=Ideonella dechloratans TaxID=36863 RepID=A0A643FCI2_IDEDE|nr:lipid-A-disaccharide synthase [Ideonella dechloratans]KAB0579976.1 lipid-A-disaccharide synthase [Ideonella dechloratans]UFU11871.1 lipid-A-disaccharide synthase [Ideonella dechloratans]